MRGTPRLVGGRFTHLLLNLRIIQHNVLPAIQRRKGIGDEDGDGGSSVFSQMNFEIERGRKRKRELTRPSVPSSQPTTSVDDYNQCQSITMKEGKRKKEGKKWKRKKPFSFISFLSSFLLLSSFQSLEFFQSKVS